MQPPDHTWLADILIAARHVQNFIAGVTREEFEQDVMRESAVIRQLAIIGEATKQLSMEFRAAHPAIPWRSVAGMRDVLIHGYRNVDIDEVWTAATVSVPELVRYVEPLIPPLDE